jgi:hypothetical protein
MAFWKRKATSRPAPAGAADPAKTAVRDDGPKAGEWLPYMFVWPVAGIVGIALYAWHVDSASVFAVAILVAGAAFLAGALLGLLFGIPRYLSTDAPTAPPVGGAGAADQRAGGGRYTPNTNLEQISDWLTKIIVGVSLVELRGIAAATRRLVDFLAPGLGGATSSPAFASALVVAYTVTGFIVAYLVTRLYLGRAFAEADDLTTRLHKVEQVQQQQELSFAAVTLANRYLELDPGDNSITQDALNEAVTAANELARVQIFNLAHEKRNKGTAAQKKRAAGLFRALIASDPEGLWHRNHGQLGYELFDEQDFAGAEEAFTTAIQRRDRAGKRGFEIYELKRALSRIAQDPAMGSGKPSDSQTVEEVLSDLRRAAQSRLRSAVQDDYRKDPRLKQWMDRNNLTENDLFTPAAATQTPAEPTTPPEGGA